MEYHCSHEDSEARTIKNGTRIPFQTVKVLAAQPYRDIFIAGNYYSKKNMNIGSVYWERHTFAASAKFDSYEKQDKYHGQIKTDSVSKCSDFPLYDGNIGRCPRLKGNDEFVPV